MGCAHAADFMCHPKHLRVQHLAKKEPSAGIVASDRYWDMLYCSRTGQPVEWYAILPLSFIELEPDYVVGAVESYEHPGLFFGTGSKPARLLAMHHGEAAVLEDGV